jgi:DNA polymerase-3 subunit delta
MTGDLAGALLHGPDAGLVALRRRQLVNFLTDGDDLRLTRLEPGVAQKDPAGIDAALRARGFFPGRRVVLIENARDALAGPLKDVFAAARSGGGRSGGGRSGGAGSGGAGSGGAGSGGARSGGAGSGEGGEDAFLVVTAQNLTARSALRRLFEGAGYLASLGLYPEPPDEVELKALLEKAGFSCGLTPEAAQDLASVANQIDRGALLQLIEMIAVYSLGFNKPLNQEGLAPLLPAAADSELERLVAAVAEGRAGAVAPLIARMAAAGVGATSMLIAVGRHFRQLLVLAVAQDGIEAALGQLRPPAFGPRRKALAAQARRWGPRRLESANRVLFQADRTLRSAGERPDRALVERCLIRLAMMVARA